jgi:hypothetical protein
MPHSPDPARLTFAPRAWLKYQFLCHAGPTEVGAFGLTDAADPLYVEDLLVLKQRTTVVTVAFDDAAVADLFDSMADVGISPGRFARVWLHTHPGASVIPSAIDEATFDRVFGACDWAVMGILGRTGRTYARVRFRAGPGGAMDLATGVDWSAWPAYAQSLDLFEDLDRWEKEFLQLVDPVVPELVLPQTSLTNPFPGGAFNWPTRADSPFLTGLPHGFR